MGKVNGNGPEGEQEYNCILSLTLALGGCGWSAPHPNSYAPEKKTHYAL